jgi:hypothetical protein
MNGIERFSCTPEVRDLPTPNVDQLSARTFDFLPVVSTPEGPQHIGVFIADEAEPARHPVIIIEPNQWSDDFQRNFNRFRGAYIRTAFDDRARIICPDMPGVGAQNADLTPYQRERLLAGSFDAVADAQWQAMMIAQAQLTGSEGDIVAPWRGRRLLLNGYSMGSNQVAAMVGAMPEVIGQSVSEIIVVMSQSPSLRQRSVGNLALSMATEGARDRGYYTSMNGDDSRLHSKMNLRGMFRTPSFWHLPLAMSRGRTLHDVLDGPSADIARSDNVKFTLIHAEGKISRASDNLYAEQALIRGGARDVERRMLLDEFHAGTESLKFHASLVRYAAREWLKH